jgi:hypothetical protein
MGIAILKAGKVIVVLKGAVAAELAEHVRNGYPQFLADLQAGNLTVQAYPDNALPSVAPPDPPTPEEIAAAEANAELDVIARKMFLVAFNHENRIRVLEGKQPVTKAQFKTAVEAI